MREKIASGVGAANMDLHGRSRKALILRDSNPGYMTASPGGVTRNVLENLSRMGHATRLLTAVGDDLYGKEILRSCASVGCGTDHCLVCPGTASSSYMALMDTDGDMFIGMSDMRILENITPAWLDTKKEVLRSSSLVTFDPCLPECAIQWLVSGVLEGVSLFADPVSTAYAKRLRPYVGSLFCLKPNIMELSAMTGRTIESSAALESAAEELLNTGLRRVVVSMGSRGCYWADQDGNRFFRALRPVEFMTDATGAGDAFMAGLLHACLEGMSPRESADWAMASGAVAVSGAGTVNPDMSCARVERILKEQTNES